MNDDPLDNPYALSSADVARAFDAAADSYAEAGVVARIAREELLERLDLVTLEPEVILDAGCGDGAALPPLRARYPGARLLAVDLSAGMLARADARGSGADCRIGDLHALDLPSGSVDLVFCSQVLPWCSDSERVLGEFRRVLRPGGLLHLSTLGPDTLIELRRAFARLDNDIHVHYFFDMHDIGDALARAGLAEPIMDVDRVTLTYADVRCVMKDLKAAGSTNLARDRRRGLGGRDRLAALARAYEPARVDGRLPATYEVIYGQAWATRIRPQKMLADGNVAVPFENLRRPSR